MSQVPNVISPPSDFQTDIFFSLPQAYISYPSFLYSTIQKYKVCIGKQGAEEDIWTKDE
jgi:hypothetical protein